MKITIDPRLGEVRRGFIQAYRRLDAQDSPGVPEDIRELIHKKSKEYGLVRNLDTRTAAIRSTISLLRWITQEAELLIIEDALQRVRSTLGKKDLSALRGDSPIAQTLEGFARTLGLSPRSHPKQTLGNLITDIEYATEKLRETLYPGKSSPKFEEWMKLQSIEVTNAILSGAGAKTETTATDPAPEAAQPHAEAIAKLEAKLEATKAEILRLQNNTKAIAIAIELLKTSE